MESYIVKKLKEKLNIKEDEAYIIYMDLLNRRKLEHLIVHLDNFKSVDELKKYYFGGH